MSLWTISTGRTFAGSEPRTLRKLAHHISPLSITNQSFREHQAGTVEGLHQVLREYPHTHRPPAPEPYREPQHNSSHEASQAANRSCFHRKYSTQQFAYLKSKTNKVLCQSANTTKGMSNEQRAMTPQEENKIWELIFPMT
jgi:hypothetical protein